MFQGWIHLCSAEHSAFLFSRQAHRWDNNHWLLIIIEHYHHYNQDHHHHHHHNHGHHHQGSYKLRRLVSCLPFCLSQLQRWELCQTLAPGLVASVQIFINHSLHNIPLNHNQEEAEPLLILDLGTQVAPLAAIMNHLVAISDYLDHLDHMAAISNGSIGCYYITENVEVTDLAWIPKTATAWVATTADGRCHCRWLVACVFAWFFLSFV